MPPDDEVPVPEPIPPLPDRRVPPPSPHRPPPPGDEDDVRPPSPVELPGRDGVPERVAAAPLSRA